MAIDKKLIDQLLTNYKKPKDIIGENGPAQRTDQSYSGAGLASRDGC